MVPSEVYVAGTAVEIPRWQEWAKAANKKIEQVVGSDHYPPLEQTETLESVA